MSEENIVTKVMSFDRALFNQGANAKYNGEIRDDGVQPTLTARGPGGIMIHYCLSERSILSTPNCGHTVLARDFKGAQIVNTIRPKRKKMICFPIEGNGSRASHKGDGYGQNGDPAFTLNTVERHALCVSLPKKDK